METNKHINKLNPEMGIEILAYGAEQSQRLALDEVGIKNGIGHMTAERWNTLHKQMKDAGLTKATLAMYQLLTIPDF